MAPKVILQSSDKVEFRVEQELAKNMSPVVKQVLFQVMECYEHETEKEHVVPFPYTPSNVLKLVIDFAESHKDDPQGGDRYSISRRYPHDTKQWSAFDQQFIKTDVDVLREVKKTAAFLQMVDLKYLSRQGIQRHMNPNAYYYY